MHSRIDHLNIGCRPGGDWERQLQCIDIPESNPHCVLERSPFVSVCLRVLHVYYSVCRNWTLLDYSYLVRFTICNMAPLLQFSFYLSGRGSHHPSGGCQHPPAVALGLYDTFLFFDN